METLLDEREILIQGEMNLLERAKQAGFYHWPNAESMLFRGESMLVGTAWRWTLLNAKIGALTELRIELQKQGYIHAKLEHAFAVAGFFESGHLPQIIGLGYDDETFTIGDILGKRILRKYYHSRIMVSYLSILVVKPIFKPRLVKN